MAYGDLFAKLPHQIQIKHGPVKKRHGDFLPALASFMVPPLSPYGLVYF
jgi:hypothetical protein